MHVLATAGHVDHGKSTLVRALTGMEPDRWAEERRRGMTIDLGYAWSALPSGEVLAYVDVPGHQRFIGNMLAGLGPAPAVLFVVAADEGWRRQSGEHLAAVDALGLTHGLLAVTRSDLADPAPAVREALAQLAGSSLGVVPAVTVSGATGQGLPELRAALDRLVAQLPPARPDGPVRLWVDRAFTIRGSGTVVTGTLGSGSLRVGDELTLGGQRTGDRTVRVRALQSLGADRTEVAAVARVAVNLRGVDVDDVGRGDVLLTRGAWHRTDELDVRVRAVDLPAELVLHVGSAAVPVRVRPLAGDVVRLHASHPLPLRAGDRGVLRDPGAQAVASGVLVLDADPPALRRRGAASRRADDLADATGTPDPVVEVQRRGAVRTTELRALGVEPTGRTVEGWAVAESTWAQWVAALGPAVAAHEAAAPLEGGLALEAARRTVGVPDLRLLTGLAAEAGLEQRGGRLRTPGATGLGPAEAAVAELERRLGAAPFAAPERPELADLRLDARALAAAEAAGRLLRLGPDLVLLPDAPARAMRVLSALPQPFTLSAARQALGTTRRVAVPLLELTDRRGWTRRGADGTREVAR